MVLHVLFFKFVYQTRCGFEQQFFGNNQLYNNLIGMQKPILVCNY